MKTRIKVLCADITTLEVDAVVNAANTRLLGGGGVDGAIHRAAGPELLEECRRLGGCPTGEAKITGGYHLPANHVIHTVGPVWKGGRSGEADLLECCYRRSLEVAAERGLTSVAFPSISTGAYRFPVEKAAGIAVRTIGDFLSDHPRMEVILCCFSESDRDVYRNALERWEKQEASASERE
ncbi:O-acetyl-ADP-ribose deacetylase [Kiritimatiella glycovorans]|uniref:O-acetyl-ADP-ribose deacetylase n=1 Tax=Kiritimatiella glycovorans TaxID=1307763 RepID=A0A0G3EHT1_9BACT|nr:O-acetyl-ADP-ribose deacetylase [Kiritimatiella glycovorans]AKJ64982.1 O-acetyl-ADP-ribose deacetylase [Kiritimatiella glycovorans]